MDAWQWEIGVRRSDTSPRLVEVAALAEVSTATVSRFLNNSDVVAPKTAERIRKAIEEVGYVPNLLAGSLASNRSKLVAVFVPEFGQNLFTDTIQSMVEEISKDGISVMLGITSPDDSRLEELIASAIGRRADAIILTGVLYDRGIRERLRNHPMMVIETWGLPATPIQIAIGFSHRAAGEATARYLAERGYKKPHLAVVRGLRAERRRDGFIEEWRKHGDAHPTETVMELPVGFLHGKRLLQEAMALDPRPDVIVCGSDQLAQSVILEAYAEGLSVPRDIAVMGFGNLSFTAEMRPSITTIAIDGARIGREAANCLRQRDTQPQAPVSIDVGFRVIARDSA